VRRACAVCVLVVAVVIGLVVLVGCTGAPVPPEPAASMPTAPSAMARSAGATTAGPEVPEPTTTNTLPPPPEPSGPAPSTAGDLGEDALPTPSGWHPTARPGGDEEGYLGNGTWVHARDPRYAAFDVMAVGCAPVTRDDYADPISALEGTYDRAGEPGIGLVLEFATASAAQRYFDLYLAQLDACGGAEAPIRVERVTSPAGLIDRRLHPEGAWIEIGKVHGRRVTLIILSDPDRSIPDDAATRLLAQIR
jgi:hypothetical protein